MRGAQRQLAPVPVKLWCRRGCGFHGLVARYPRYERRDDFGHGGVISCTMPPLCLGAPAQVRHRGRVARARASASMPPAPPPVLHRLAAPDARASSSDPRRIWDLRESRRSSVRSAAEARSAIARALPSAQYEHGHRRTCPRQGARKLAVVCRAVRWSPASLQQTRRVLTGSGHGRHHGCHGSGEPRTQP